MNQFGTWDFVKVFTLENPALQLTGWSKFFLLYTEAGARTDCSRSRQMVNDGRSNNFNDP